MGVNEPHYCETCLKVLCFLLAGITIGSLSNSEDKLSHTWLHSSLSSAAWHVLLLSMWFPDSIL